MAINWRFAVCLSVLLLLSRSLASSDADHASTDHSSASGSDHANTSSSDHNNADSGHDSGHGGDPITTLPIVSWKWHHVEAPYIVVLWILVCWICKIGECPRSSPLQRSILALRAGPLANRLGFASSLSHVWKGRKQVLQSAGFTKTRAAINLKPSVKAWLSRKGFFYIIVGLLCF